MGQRHHRGIAVAAAIGDEHRRQLTTNLHAIQHDAFKHFVPRITQDHLEPQTDSELGTGLSDAGIPSQQQALGRADTHANPIDFTLDAHALFTIIEQTARTVGQVDFTDQPTSPQQR
ncbi:hypothetical protein D3C81_1764650 [compost metagenome]